MPRCRRRDKSDLSYLRTLQNMGYSPAYVIIRRLGVKVLKLRQQNEQQTSDWADFGPPDFLGCGSLLFSFMPAHVENAYAS